MALHPGERKRHLPEEAPVAWDPIRRDLKENEDWCRDLVEHSHDLLCVHDLQGRFLSVNPGPARVLGYSVEEVLRKPMRDFIDPQFLDQFDAYLREIERTGEAQGLLALVTRSGERRIWEYHNTLRTEGVETPIVRGIAHDVTERMRAQKALRESNDQLLATARAQERTLRELTLFRTLLDQSNDAILVTDPETLRFLDSNERAWAELGYSREELLSMTVFDIDPDIASVRTQVDQQLRPAGCAIIERAHRRKDGTTFPVELNLHRVRLDREYDVAVSRDITERKQAEEALRESEERFRVALKNSPIAVFQLDRDLRYTWSYNSQLPSPASDKLGKTLFELFDPEEAARMTEVRRRVLETGVGVRDEIHVTFGGKKHYFETTIEPVLDSTGTVIGLTGASMDVTELRETTEALHEAKKKLTEEKLYLEQEIDTALGFGEIIGRSKALQTVMEHVGKVAASTATVLLLGETGTGKELVARAIHRMSERANTNFIKMNCAAIPSGLLESELFGN